MTRDKQWDFLETAVNQVESWPQWKKEAAGMIRKENPVGSICNKPGTVTDDDVRKRVMQILEKWRNTDMLTAGRFQDFLLDELDSKVKINI